jgi:hypothetical protein
MRKAPQRTHADRTAARLVAREPGTIEQANAPALEGQGAGGGGSGGSAADDEHVRSARHGPYRAGPATVPSPRPSETRFASSL